MKKILFSYCIANQSYAEQIISDLKKLGVESIPFIRSRSEYTNEENFVNQNPELPVVILVTDNLLKSIDGLYKIADIFHLAANRVLPIVADGVYENKDGSSYAVKTAFNTINEVMGYRDFWYDKWINLRKKKNPEIPDPELDDLISISQKASTTAGGVLRSIRDFQPLMLDLLKQENYVSLLARLNFSGQIQGAAPVSEKAAAVAPVASEPVAPPPPPPPVVEKPVVQEEKPKEKVEDELHQEPVYKPQYVETVTKEMEKAAQLIREFSDEDEEEQDNTVEEEPAMPSIHAVHPSKAAQMKFEAYQQAGVSGQEAIQELEAIIALDNLHTGAYQELGKTHLALGNYDDARLYFEKALALKPEDASINFAAGKILADHFEHHQHLAAAYIKNAIMLDGNQPDYFMTYGRLLKERFHKDKLAIKNFQKALELNPELAEAHLELAHLYRHDEALAGQAADHYRSAVEIDPSLRTETGDEIFGYSAPEDDVPQPEEHIQPEAQAIENIEVTNKPGLIAVVTGATSGIGKATAERLAKGGYKLILTGRRADRLEEFAQYLRDSYRTDVHTLNFDVRHQQEVETAINNLPEEWKNIDILVNNAGLAKGFDTIDTGNIEHWEQMIDTNIKGLLYVTRAVTPGMVARKKGHIINIGSTAGKEVYLKGNVYCATKFAVDALSKGMRMDLFTHGIRVTAINPGHTEETEFAFVRFEDQDKAKIYDDFKPLKASDVADVIHYVVSLPEYVTIHEITLSGTQQANVSMIDRSGR